MITMDLTSAAAFNWCQGLCLPVQVNQHPWSSKDHICKAPKEAEIFLVFFPLLSSTRFSEMLAALALPGALTACGFKIKH